MAGILSYIPLLNRLVGPSSAPKRIVVPPVTVHDVETAADKRSRTLKHLLRANHANHAILYHNLQHDNHMPHALAAAYLLGADAAHLHAVYEAEARGLEPWADSPEEITRDDWRMNLGRREYQRAYVDFFEDALADPHKYEWRKVVEEFMFQGDEPLVNGLIGGLGHPLIHLAYAYEINSKEVAMEALGLAACQYNFLHRYIDDAAYTRPAPFSSAAPRELLDRLAGDARLDGAFREPGFENIEPLFEKHEAVILEYWNAWAIGSDPLTQFRLSQEAAVDLLVATVKPGTHAYNFFLVHVLTTSHAVRVLLPVIPAKFHIPLLRQWWLLTLAVYIAEMRPKIDPDNIPTDLKGRRWNYIEQQALTSEWSPDAHYVKAIRVMKEAEQTWGDIHDRYLQAAMRFVDEFKGWTF